jgi:hypothetical protein
MPSVGSIMNSKLLGKALTPGNVLTVGMDAWVGVSTFNEAKDKGNGTLMSAAKAGGEVFLNHALGMGAYMGLMALPAVPKLGIQAYEGLAKMSRSMSNPARNNPFAGANFMDSQQAYTMRQAGMKLAKASKYNQQQAMLGNEAQYMHY